MENVLERYQRANSVLILTSGRNFQTLVEGELLQVKRGEKLVFVVDEVDSSSGTCSGIFILDNKEFRFEYEINFYAELIEEFIKLTENQTICLNKTKN